MAENTGEKPAVRKKRKVRFGLRFKFSLAVTLLVTLIVATIAVFFVWRESNLLRNQYMQLVERELQRLAAVASRAIATQDELAITAPIEQLKELSYIRYAYVLDTEGNVIRSFHRSKELQMGEKLEDGVNRILPETAGPVQSTIYDDPEARPGSIIDMATIFTHPFQERNLGAVVVGMSDSVIREEIYNLTRYIITFSLGFLFLGILGALVLSGIIIRPVRVLSKGAEIIGSGDLSYRINIQSSDELGQLAEEFNEMTAQIQDAKDKEIEQRIMDEQLETARDIQEGLNPMHFYNKAGIQIKGYTRAAKGVGGDYFDFIDIDEHRVGALISDVSGKGVPASLVMVMIRTVFTSYITRKDVDSSRVVRAINDSLSADFAIDKFATLFFMIYDRRTGELTFSNAGHGPLFCYRAGLKACTLAGIEGVPIGIMEDVDYNQAKVKLEPGDMVVLYTDGVTEMRNEEKDEYGRDRVQQMMLQHNDLDAQEFVNLLIEDVDRFRGTMPPHDDTTALVFKRAE